MPSVIENIKADMQKQLAKRIEQASIDNFKMFQEFLEFEQTVMYSSASKKIVLYDPKHAAISQRDIYKKIAECTKVTVEEQKGPDGSIQSKIIVTCDGLDLSEPYVKESFQNMLNSVNTRMQYNIRS